MAKIKQADGSVIIPDGWMPASQVNPPQSALSTLLAVSLWRSMPESGRKTFHWLYHLWRLKHTDITVRSVGLDINKNEWEILMSDTFFCLLQKGFVNSAPCSPKTCGVDPKWCNKQSSKQETEEGSMVIMRPGSTSARSKHIFTFSTNLHSPFSLIWCLHFTTVSIQGWYRVIHKTVKVIYSRIEVAKRWMEKLQLWPQPGHSKKHNYVSLWQRKVRRVG